MEAFTSEDRQRVEDLRKRCQACMATGYWMSPNLGYVISKDCSEEAIRAIYLETLGAMNELGPRYHITDQVLFGELRASGHPFWEMALTWNHLGFAMKLAHIQANPY